MLQLTSDTFVATRSVDTLPQWVTYPWVCNTFIFVCSGISNNCACIDLVYGGLSNAKVSPSHSNLELPLLTRVPREALLRSLIAWRYSYSQTYQYMFVRLLRNHCRRYRWYDYQRARFDRRPGHYSHCPPYTLQGWWQGRRVLEQEIAMSNTMQTKGWS